MTVKDVALGAPGVAAPGGLVSARFTVGARRITGLTSSVTSSGVVSCRAKVPGGTTGKTLKGRITYRYKGVTISKTFTARVS
jgi:hypothetical protein